jgi:phosphoglycerate kinase
MVAAKHAAERTKAKKLISVAGGGDTVAALNQAGWRAIFPMSRPRAARFLNGWRETLARRRGFEGQIGST